MQVKANPTPKTKSLPPFEHARLEAGHFGVFFGTGNNASRSIAGTTIFLLIFTIILMIMLGSSYLSSYLQITIPVITAALGYLFGNKA